MTTKKSHTIQPYERDSKLGIKEIIWNNFIGGMFWALGATIGLSLIITLLTLISKNVNLVPLVGSFASQVLDFILAHNPNLQK